MSNATMPHGKRWNRTLQEAQRLGMSEDRLIKFYNRGIVPGTKLSQRIVLFQPDEVDKALKRYGKAKQ
jgi:hypothetical protein